MADEKTDPTKQRRPMAPSLAACHKISGIMDGLDEEDIPWVLGWLCGQYAPPEFSFNTKAKEANGHG